MFGRLFHKSAMALLLALGVLGFVLAPAARSQTPSDADTMRILDAGALPGDTVIIDFFLKNVNVLGGYAFRLRYDQSLIEPLTDTVLFDTTTVYTVEAQEVRGTSFESKGGYVRSPGEMVFGVFDLMHAPYSPDTTFYYPGRAVAVCLRWRVNTSATPQTTPIYFENDPLLPSTWNTLTDLSGLILKRPVLVPGNFTILSPNCSWQGDANDNGLAYEVGDLIYLINYAFSAGVPPRKIRHVPGSTVVISPATELWT